MVDNVQRNIKSSTHTWFGLLTGSRVTDFEELSQTKCSNYNQTCCAVIRLVHAISFDAHFFFFDGHSMQ